MIKFIYKVISLVVMNKSLLQEFKNKAQNQSMSPGSFKIIIIIIIIINFILTIVIYWVFAK